MRVFRKIAFVSIAVLIAVQFIMAGNPDRRGQAGASELLLNPWARSSGLHSLNTASVHGIEAIKMNLGGLAFTPKTEAVFSHTQWLQGTGITFNTLGISQHVGESGVLGLDVMSINFGEWDVTTSAQPEGGLGTVRPQYLNLGLGYARSFSNSIHGGAAIRVVNESIANVSATGVALDAGIQYVTGPQENIKFGIALRNVGTPMRFTGDGLSFLGEAPIGDHQMTLEMRSENFEMPSLLHIGGAYDFLFQQETHRVTVVGNFTSNSFISDQMGLGVEYAFNEMFMGRVGYKVENTVIQGNAPNLAYSGLSAGATVEIPLKKEQQAEEGEEDEETEEEKETTIPTVGLDFSYRATRTFGGVFSIGARINL